MDGGRLVMRWLFWLANTLLPVRHNVFDLESWPVRVSFDTDATGRAHAFRCAGPRLAWGAPPGATEGVRAAGRVRVEAHPHGPRLEIEHVVSDR